MTQTEQTEQREQTEQTEQTERTEHYWSLSWPPSVAFKNNA